LAVSDVNDLKRHLTMRRLWYPRPHGVGTTPGDWHGLTRKRQHGLLWVPKPGISAEQILEDLYRLWVELENSHRRSG
jgi:hypothetical protein